MPEDSNFDYVLDIETFLKLAGIETVMIIVRIFLREELVEISNKRDSCVIIENWKC